MIGMFSPAPTNRMALTVLFVDARGVVTEETSLRRPFMFTDRLRMLKTPG